MAYRVEFSEDAERHLGRFTAREQAIIIDAIDRLLSSQPTTATRRRKFLRANPLATWELRARDFRVFYNVDEQEVVVAIIAIGQKMHNVLYIEGHEFEL
jgi:mRNA-degrading endonuclease RelE of RelBE toxin-antitoxin system